MGKTLECLASISSEILDRISSNDREGLVCSGVPHERISEIKNISKIVLDKFALTIETEKRVNARINLIKEAYKRAYSNNSGLATLDNYISSYDGKSLFNRYYFVIKGLDELAEAGYVFDFKPAEREAYVFGANLGKGSMSDIFQLYFTGTDEHLSLLKQMIGLPTVKGSDHGLIYRANLGRFYHLLGLPKGDRMQQNLKIPEWINQRKELRKNFLAGLFDTSLSSNSGNFSMITHMSVNYRESFYDYLHELTQMMADFGIDIKSKGIRFRYDGDRIVGSIYISRKRDNLRKLSRIFPMRKTLNIEHPPTEFELEVYDAVSQIPKGETRSYEDIAQKINSYAVPVAAALKKFKMKIPSHRVIRKDGKIGRCHMGTLLKQQKLEEEGVILN